MSATHVIALPGNRPDSGPLQVYLVAKWFHDLDWRDRKSVFCHKQLTRTIDFVLLHTDHGSQAELRNDCQILSTGQE
jgi:hypothetical protein